ncbi:BlaI/MecI/CopY family transcriptional regulator [bacterium]|nr:BlaI/MecI/CopY family transcriptional regulator [bacterium]
MVNEKFTRLQLRIMQVLWQRKRATAREITDALAALEPIAHSTVQTLLRRLERRKVIDHDENDATFEYFPLVRNERVVQQMFQDFLDRLFAGSPQGMVSYLLKNRYVTPGELKELSELSEKRSNKR